MTATAERTAVRVDQIRRRRPPLSPATRLATIGRWVFLAGLAVYFGLPMLWILLAPSKTHTELATRNPFAFGSFSNYRTAFDNLLSYNNEQIYRWIGNSAVYTAGSVLLCLFSCVPAGYALARTRMAGRQLILIVTLIAMVTPGAARTIPLFLEMNAVHLTNTMWAVILPSGFFPFGVYLCYIYFSTSLPYSIIEAARVDGVTEFGIFLRIALPLARPVIGLVTFFSFIGGWNDYFLPFIMLNSDSLYNLPVGLGALISSSPGIIPGSTPSDLPIYQPEVALAGLIAVLPVVVTFLACQRYLTAGLLDGAVKD